AGRACRAAGGAQRPSLPERRSLLYAQDSRPRLLILILNFRHLPLIPRLLFRAVRAGLPQRAIERVRRFDQRTISFSLGIFQGDAIRFDLRRQRRRLGVERDQVFPTVELLPPGSLALLRVRAP